MFRISFRVLLPLLLRLPLVAQTSTGKIDITVLDPSGAVVPNAAITVTGSETGNRVCTISSNAEGVAAAPLLSARILRRGRHETSPCLAGLSRVGVAESQP